MHSAAPGAAASTASKQACQEAHACNCSAPTSAPPELACQGAAPPLARFTLFMLLNAPCAAGSLRAPFSSRSPLTASTIGELLRPSGAGALAVRPNPAGKAPAGAPVPGRVHRCRAARERSACSRGKQVAHTPQHRIHSTCGHWGRQLLGAMRHVGAPMSTGGSHQRRAWHRWTLVAAAHGAACRHRPATRTASERKYVKVATGGAP